MNLIVLLAVALVVGFVALSVMFRGRPDAGAVLAVIFSALTIVLAIANMVTLIQLTRAMGWSTLAIVGVVLAMFLVSFAGIVVVLVVISRGNKILKEAGLRVGLLGVSPKSVRAWLAQHPA